MALESKAIPNLIQGVSQQAAQQRRDSQCEEQFDCLNSPKDGCIARHGADLIARHDGLDLTGAWTYELFRGSSEHYLVTVLGGVPRVFNLETGSLATVTNGVGYGNYLTADGGSAKDNFCAQTVDDFTFIASKVRKPEMAATVSPARPKEALLFFRAGAYLARYSVAVSFAGNLYRWTYTTPDNSHPGNAYFIRTGQLAATFYRALTSVDARASGNSYGVGASDEGDPGGSGTGTISVVDGSTNLLSLGFNVEINGNLIRISRNDGQDFEVDTADSVGDTYLTSVKDNVASFADLPKGGFEGFTVRVRGKGEDAEASDYYVEYVRKTATSGFWQERVKPGTQTTLDADKMPHALVNTGPDTFELRRMSWSTRIAGDGDVTAKDPGFVGKNIRDLFFHKGRLGILTEATADWSKARNPFTFFPDTVQTVLADAPIGVEIAAGETIALLRRVLQMDESLFLWAQRSQFRVHSGADPFRQDTVSADPTSAYEFAEGANFPKVGTSAYFATEPEDFANVRNLQFQNGKPVGDVDVTDHVPDYIPAGVRRMAVTDTGKVLMVQTDGAPNRLYPYNFLVQDRQIVQSAWQTWRLPEGTILWSSIYRMYVYIALQRSDGVYLLKLPLRATATDPGGDYSTRMDLRVNEEDVTTSYDPDERLTALTLPYSLYPSEEANVLVAVRESGGTEELPFARGREFVVTSASGNTVVVRGDLTGYKFYVGLRISSEREESTFYLRGPNGVVPTDSLTIREFVAYHDRTGYYRVEVNQGAGRSKTYELKPILMGETNNAIGTAPGLVQGQLNAAVDQIATECRIRLVNDSFLPSRWQTAEYRYEAVLRAKPSRVRSSE